MIERRAFLTLLGGGVARPLAARAQQTTVRVGWFNAGSSEGYELGGLRHHLNEAGFVKGQNLMIEPRWANNQYERLPALAAELCSAGVT
jgi:putative ABC transport system substrate-binding protein